MNRPSLAAEIFFCTMICCILIVMLILCLVVSNKPPGRNKKLFLKMSTVGRLNPISKDLNCGAKQLIAARLASAEKTK